MISPSFFFFFSFSFLFFPFSFLFSLVLRIPAPFFLPLPSSSFHLFYFILSCIFLLFFFRLAFEYSLLYAVFFFAFSFIHFILPECAAVVLQFLFDFVLLIMSSWPSRSIFDLPSGCTCTCLHVNPAAQMQVLISQNIISCSQPTECGCSLCSKQVMCSVRRR